MVFLLILIKDLILQKWYPHYKHLLYNLKLKEVFFNIKNLKHLFPMFQIFQLLNLDNLLKNDFKD